MYVSMTGFSRSQAEQPWGTLSLEISSVNHRYQEIYVRLPREFSSWEPWFHQKLRGCFRRGKLQVRMEVLWAPAYRMGRINKDILNSYCEELLQVQRSMGQARELELEKIVSLKKVFVIYAEQLIVFGPYLRDLPVYERASFSWALLYEPEVLRREYDYIYYPKKLVEPVYRYTIYLYGLFA